MRGRVHSPACQAQRRPGSLNGGALGAVQPGAGRLASGVLVHGRDKPTSRKILFKSDSERASTLGTNVQGAGVSRDYIRSWSNRKPLPREFIQSGNRTDNEKVEPQYVRVFSCQNYDLKMHVMICQERASTDLIRCYRSSFAR